MCIFNTTLKEKCLLIGHPCPGNFRLASTSLDALERKLARQDRTRRDRAGAVQETVGQDNRVPSRDTLKVLAFLWTGLDLKVFLLIIIKYTYIVNIYLML